MICIIIIDLYIICLIIRTRNLIRFIILFFFLFNCRPDNLSNTSLYIKNKFPLLLSWLIIFFLFFDYNFFLFNRAITERRRAAKYIK